MILVRFPASYSDAEFADYLRELSSALAREPLAIILDTRGAQTPSATQRQQLMQFAKAQWQNLHRLRGAAFIVDSSVARHAMTAVSWVVSKPCPVEFVASMGEALDWADLHGAPLELRAKHGVRLRSLLRSDVETR